MVPDSDRARLLGRGQAAMCGDVLRLGDDYGDNECSFTCMLELGHDGPHRNEFEHEEKSIVVTWTDGKSKK